MAKLPPGVLEFFKREGEKGGKKAAERMSATERSERAKKAAAKSAAVRSKKARSKKKDPETSLSRKQS